VDAANAPKTISSRNDEVRYIGGELGLSVAEGNKKRTIAGVVRRSVGVVPGIYVDSDQDRALGRGAPGAKHKSRYGDDSWCHEIEY
jgi:hypothetical protein